MRTLPHPHASPCLPSSPWSARRCHGSGLLRLHVFSKLCGCSSCGLPGKSSKVVVWRRRGSGGLDFRSVGKARFGLPRCEQEEGLWVREKGVRPFAQRRSSLVFGSRSPFWVVGFARLMQMSAVGLQRWQVGVKGFGRVLGLGVLVMLMALFPHRLLLGSAYAAVSVTGEVKEEVEVKEEAEVTEEDRERLVEEGRKEGLEREGELVATLKLDEKLKELEAFEVEENLSSEKSGDVLRKMSEVRVVTSVEVRRYRATLIRERDSVVGQLEERQAQLVRDAEKAVADYDALCVELDREAGAEGSREEAAKDVEERLADFRKRYVELEEEISKHKYERSQTAFVDLPRVEDRVDAQLESFWESWKEKVKNREKKKLEEAQDQDLIRGLEMADKEILEQNILPVALGIQGSEETFAADVGLDPDAKKLMQQVQEEEEKVQAIIDKVTKNKVDNPRNILEGLSQHEIDMVMNSDKDVLEELHPSMVLGWKKWNDEIKDEYDQLLKDNPQISQELAVAKQEKILISRDRVVSRTFFNEKEKRWEMEPVAVSYSVTKGLADKARIRHDRRVMYLTLKGEDREYCVNLQAYEAEFHVYGGFEELYFKMNNQGVKISFELMWIPFSEWDVGDLFQLPFKMAFWALQDLWNSSLVRAVRPFYWKTLSEAFEEVMIRFGFPLVQALVPPKARVALRFDLPEGAEAAEPTDIMAWQQEAQKKVDGRYGEGTGSPPWWIYLPLRSYAVGIPLFYLLKYVVPVLVFPFKPRPLEPNEVEWKEKKQKELLKDLEAQSKKEKKDPIRSVFDKMKRVKRPQVSLDDFAGIDALREGINEVVNFLRSPKLFKEMGARPPRGILIVGESGTGKTTLALAIAAEARVPMIELQGAELEGGSWVGQGASNVRELFKTARSLAPLIIFMDDFDHFAGVRGATSDTRKQDHESLINQLLVELDGFETQEGVVLIATTSRPWAIDEALRRPGRMDRTINLPMPNRREREQILLKVARDTMDANLIPLVDWTRVAEKTAGLTPAQLKLVPRGIEGSAVSCKASDDEELFSLFGWLATFNGMTPRWVKDTPLYKHLNEKLLDWLDLRVTKEEIEAAVDSMDVYGQANPGLELTSPPYVWTREFKYPHAVWAAGRGLVALLLPEFDVVEQIWLDPTSWEGIGFTKLSKRLTGGYHETGIMTRSYYEKQLVLCFGSFIAARLYIQPGDNNNLCRFEIEDGIEIATRMVLEHGWSPDDSPVIYMPDGAPGTLVMGEDHEFELEAKIQKLFYAACDRARQMIFKNRKVLDALLEHILQYDIATKKDMTKLLEENQAIFEVEPFFLVSYSRPETQETPTNGTSRAARFALTAEAAG